MPSFISWWSYWLEAFCAWSLPSHLFHQLHIEACYCSTTFKGGHAAFFSDVGVVLIVQPCKLTLLHARSSCYQQLLAYPSFFKLSMQLKLSWSYCTRITVLVWFRRWLSYISDLLFHTLTNEFWAFFFFNLRCHFHHIWSYFVIVPSIGSCFLSSIGGHVCL